MKWNLLTIAQFSVGTHNMDLFRCPLSLCFSLLIETNIFLPSGNSRDPSFFCGLAFEQEERHVSDEATAASCEFPWVLPSEYCSHVEEAQSCSYNLPLFIQPKWLLTQLRLHNTSKRLFIAQKHSLGTNYQCSCWYLWAFVIRPKPKKKLLFFTWPINADFRGIFCSAFWIEVCCFFVLFPQIPSIHLPLHSHRFPHICKFMQMEMLANTMLKFMRRIISIDNTKWKSQRL